MEKKSKKTNDKSGQSKGLTQKEEVPRNKDKHIDQDFPGYPHQPAAEKTINPKTEEDKVNANLKTNNDPAPEKEQSLGSANAFEATEGGDVLREELDDDKDEKNKENYY
jgi:hypothetical protein